MRLFETRPLLRLYLDVGHPADLRCPQGFGRLVYDLKGGSFEGDRLSGCVWPVRGDWVSVTADQARIDARLQLTTSDGAEVFVSCEDTIPLEPQQQAQMQAGLRLQPGVEKIRVSPVFKTKEPQNKWLEDLTCIGVGHRTSAGLEFDIQEVLETEPA